MVKIGNILTVIFLSFSSCFAEPKIFLKALSSDGTELKKAAIGVPFKLEIIATDLESQQNPTISGLDQVKVISTSSSSSINIINSHTSYQKKFYYIVRADDIKTLKIGPAYIDTPSGRIESLVLQLPVAQSEEVRAVDKNAQKAKIELIVDKNEIYLGEVINCKIRFYYLDDSIKVQELQKLNVENAEITDYAGPQFSKDFNSDLPNYVEYSCKIYPKKVGKIIIPAIRGIYAVKSKDSFLNFFMSEFDQKQIFSNSVQIDVSHLPKYKEPVDAIGDFKTFELKITPTFASQAAAMVLSLKITGNGNLDNIKHPKLDLPENFKYTESKTLKSDGAGKVFEYIVQGLKEGDYTIGSQKFIFFDPKIKRFRKLKSNEIPVKIGPPLKTVAEVKEFDWQETETQQKTEIAEKFEKEESYKIPWFWFWLIFLIPTILFLILIIFDLIYKLWPVIKQYLKYLLAFYNAKKSLNYARKKHDSTFIYTIFVKLFSIRLNIDEREITKEKIIQELKANDKIKKELSNFWDLMIESRFYKPDVDQISIFEKSFAMLKTLKKLI